MILEVVDDNGGALLDTVFAKSEPISFEELLRTQALPRSARGRAGARGERAVAERTGVLVEWTVFYFCTREALEA